MNKKNCQIKGIRKNNWKILELKPKTSAFKKILLYLLGDIGYFLSNQTVKRVWPPKIQGEKDVKSKVAAKKWL